MSSKALERDLTSGNIVKQMCFFVGPLFLSNVLQATYSMVDMAVVGHFAGSEGLSAVSIGGEVVTALTFAALGFSNSGQILISQYTGANLPDKRKRLIGTLFSTLLIVSLILTFLTITFCRQIIDFMNTPPEAAEGGWIYLTTSAVGLVFVFGYNGVCSILRGMGNARHPFVFAVIASFLNIVLDIVFVIRFSMGVFGVAFATVISQATSFGCALVFLYRNRNQCGFDFHFRNFAITGEIVPLLRLGIPLAIQYCMIQGSKIIVARWINIYGVSVSAITGIGAKMNSIGVMFASAVDTSVASVIGQCVGAKKYKRIVEAILTAFALSITTASILVLFVVIFPDTVFGLFTKDPDVLNLVKIYIPVVVVMLYSGAFRAPMNGLIVGTGNARLTFVVAIIDSIVGHIGFAALLGFALGYGIQGIWLGNAAAGFVPFFVGMGYLFSGKWKVTTK